MDPRNGIRELTQDEIDAVAGGKSAPNPIPLIIELIKVGGSGFAKLVDFIVKKATEGGHGAPKA